MAYAFNDDKSKAEIKVLKRTIQASSSSKQIEISSAELSAEGITQDDIDAGKWVITALNERWEMTPAGGADTTVFYMAQNTTNDKIFPTARFYRDDSETDYRLFIVTNHRQTVQSTTVTVVLMKLDKTNEQRTEVNP